MLSSYVMLIVSDAHSIVLCFIVTLVIRAIFVLCLIVTFCSLFCDCCVSDARSVCFVFVALAMRVLSVL